MTVQQQQVFATPADINANESCLVQIYPADVIDGMMLLDSDTLNIGVTSSVTLHWTTVTSPAGTQKSKR